MRTIHKILLIAGVIIVSIGTFVGAFRLGPVLSKTSEKHSKVCESTHKATHTVTIENDIASPGKTDAKLCDTLTIINKDRAPRLIAFGQHDRHITYDGVTEQHLGQGQSLSVTLNQPGSFIFHDHDNEEVGGTFTVSR